MKRLRQLIICMIFATLLLLNTMGSAFAASSLSIAVNSLRAGCEAYPNSATSTTIDGTIPFTWHSTGLSNGLRLDRDADSRTTANSTQTLSSVGKGSVDTKTAASNQQPKSFFQGSQYASGAYSSLAQQPTVYNWVRQSQYTVGDSVWQKWTYPMKPCTLLSAPVIGADGTIYFNSQTSDSIIVGSMLYSTYSCNLYALKADGSLKWIHSIGQFKEDRLGELSPPTIGADGTIYTGALSGMLYAFTADGSVKWYHPIGNHVTSSPVIGADGTIYVGTDEKLYAFAESGTQKWFYTVEGGVASTPALGKDGTIYFSSYNKFNAVSASGHLKWSYGLSQNFSSPAIGQDGTIYIGAHDGRLYALKADGSLKWTFSAKSEVCSAPAIGADGTIYFGFGGDRRATVNRFYALNPDGSQKWAYKTGDSFASSPIIGADGMIYAFTTNGKLDAFTTDGHVKWSYLTQGYYLSAPAIGADGTIYTAENSTKGLLALSSVLKETDSGCLASGGVNVSYSQTLSAAGGKAPYIWSATGLPDGLSINRSTGVVSGIPNKQGSYTISVKVTDSAAASATATASLTLQIGAATR